MQHHVNKTRIAISAKMNMITLKKEFITYVEQGQEVAPIPHYRQNP